MSYYALPGDEVDGRGNRNPMKIFQDVQESSKGVMIISRIDCTRFAHLCGRCDRGKIHHLKRPSGLCALAFKDETDKNVIVRTVIVSSLLYMMYQSFRPRPIHPP